MSEQSDYERLIQPIEDRMIRTVWRIVRDPDDADDTLQEALETIWRRWDRVRCHPNPHAAILRICINAAYDTLRRRSKQCVEALEETAVEVADPAPLAAERIAREEMRREIFASIARLPRKQAEAALMRFVQEMPYGDIAKALACREATVRKHIKRARARLCASLVHLVPAQSKKEASHESK